MICGYSRVFSTVMIIVIALVTACSTMSLTALIEPMTMNVAEAAEFDPNSYRGDGFNELMTGNKNDMGGWDENVITEGTGENGNISSDTETGGKKITGALSKLTTDLMVPLFGVAFILTLVRFTFRGIYELALGNPGEKSRDIPNILKTHKERKGEKTVGWFKDMVVESFILFAIVLGVWALLAIIVSAVAMFFDVGILPASNDAGFSSLSFGGINVATN